MAKTNYNKMSNKPKEDVKNEVEVVVEETEVAEVITEAPAVEETVTDAPAPEKKPAKKVKIGVVSNCSKLNVRTNPHPNAHVELIIDKGTEVEIVGSNGDFYDVRKGTTTEGFSGWCMKKYISIK
jgi:uncharacterized protein YgiM (DUF1202 family)